MAFCASHPGRIVDVTGSPDDLHIG